jgi:hypothetical protein
MTTATERPSAPRPRTALLMLAAVPPLGVALTTLTMLVMSVAGQHPMWRLQVTTLSEAAASRDVATAVWLIEQGRDPNHKYPVRRGILDGNTPAAMTPLEAAVDARRLEVIQLLLRHGARLDETQRTAFACKAKSRGDEELIRYFESLAGPVTCTTSGGNRE